MVVPMAKRFNNTKLATKRRLLLLKIGKLCVIQGVCDRLQSTDELLALPRQEFVLRVRVTVEVTCGDRLQRAPVKPGDNRVLVAVGDRGL